MAEVEHAYQELCEKVQEAEITRRVILEETGVQAKIKFSVVATVAELFNNIFS